MTLGDGALLAVAAACGGVVNAIAGGGSLISFSALIAVGYPPVTANVTNTLGVLPGYLGGSIGYASELRGQGRRVRGLALTSGLGALAGAVLLITTPAEVFEFVVPLLILASCALLVVQPRLTRLLAATDGDDRSVALQVAAFAAGVYGGYFAAGFGVLLLAMLGLFLSGGIQRLNALKGVLSLIIGAVAATTFAAVGPIAWSAAAVMGVASYVGGHAGVSFARRLPANGLRWGIAIFGTIFALVLLIG